MGAVPVAQAQALVKGMVRVPGAQAPRAAMVPVPEAWVQSKLLPARQSRLHILQRPWLRPQPSAALFESSLGHHGKGQVLFRLYGARCTTSSSRVCTAALRWSRNFGSGPRPYSMNGSRSPRKSKELGQSLSYRPDSASSSREVVTGCCHWGVRWAMGARRSRVGAWARARQPTSRQLFQGSRR